MSMDLYVFYDGQFPNLIEWQKTIDGFGFDLKFSRDQILIGEGGLIKAKWKTRDASFEFRPCDFDKLTETYDDIDFGRRWSTAYAFYWSGLPECVAAYIAAVTLAQMRDGVVFDPQDSLILRDQEAIRMARENELLLPKIEASLRH
ncbi:hypothetical protein [Methylobacterium sp. Leaf469]|jgi:hypothetical protein|uniref:hypothetical protein n=1 Tax=Methylobacterium sp. Leaf469 TaxID=1736387 RepID=UPI000B09A240|nr:hypothetical protein [Methylobacterium sp. Leaf469]